MLRFHAEVVLAHLNHQLRGAESDADENFVQRLSEAWSAPNLRVRTERLDISGLAQGENLEGAARRERYRWLAAIAVEEEASWIATGHNADDQAETVLFRLLRGSGLRGLTGIAECRPIDGAPRHDPIVPHGPLGIHLVRPLLQVRRSEILAYAEANRLTYCTDSSNADRRFTRNRLRHELLPVIEKDYNAGIVEVLGRLAEQAHAMYADISAEAARLLAEAELPRAGAMLVFQSSRLRGATPNLVREMFRLVWQRENWPTADMDFDRWNRLVAIVQGACPIWEFPGPVRVSAKGGVIQLIGQAQ
jgi:tRNA(Ile)-lysidine synthase